MDNTPTGYRGKEPEYGEEFEVNSQQTAAVQHQTVRIVHDAVEGRHSIQELGLKEMLDADGNVLMESHPITLKIVLTEAIRSNVEIKNMVDDIIERGEAVAVSVELIDPVPLRLRK